jgi:hypothetical protein
MITSTIDTNDTLVKTTIRKREVVFFLVSEDDINSLKSKSMFADVFMLLASLAWGAFLSAYITRSTSIQPQDQVVILLWCFGIAGLVLSLSAIVFLLSANSAIKRIKGSGKVEGIGAKKVNGQEPQPVQTSPKSNLHVVEAIYYTQKNSANVTAKMNQLVENNRLMMIVSNDLVDGNDPDYGTRKKLRVKYETNGVEITKEYKERDLLNLP